MSCSVQQPKTTFNQKEFPPWDFYGYLIILHVLAFFNDMTNTCTTTNHYLRCEARQSSTDIKTDSTTTNQTSWQSNLPKQVMNFPDYSFPAETSSFMHNAEVRKYLEDYATHFNVVPCIRFQTKVLLIDPLPNPQEGDWCRWKVNSQQLGCHLVEEEEFDAVVVCNGHYSVPCYPNIPGLENYKKKKLHSHYYRDPEAFRGVKNALVLGFGPSGRDIGLELATVCEKVYLSHKGARLNSKIPDCMNELTNISHVTDDGSFVTESGDVIRDVDLFLICTGYYYDFPFVSEKAGLKVTNGKIVDNLFKHMINIDNPSLCFVGLPFQAPPFPNFHMQSACVTSVLSGVKKLPSRTEMLLDTENEKQEQISLGMPPEYYHVLLVRSFPYWDDLAELFGCKNIPPVVKKMMHFVLRPEGCVTKYCQTYKDMEFRQVGDDDFVVLNPEKFPEVCGTST